MRKLWNMGGRRVAAFLMAAFLTFMSIPTSNWGTRNVLADEPTYTITVSMTDAEGNGINDAAVATIEVTDSDDSTVDDGLAITSGASRTVIVTTAAGYKVSKLTVTNIDDYTVVEVTEDGNASTTEAFEYEMADITANYEVIATIEAEVPSYTITVSQTGNGEITLENGTIENGAFEAEEGTSAKLIIVPESGYEVTGISLDGTSLAFSDVTYAEGNYEYQFENIDSAKTISVTFSEIDSETKTNVAAMAEIGTLSDKDGNAINVTDDTTMYCAEEMTLTALTGQLICLDNSGSYTATVSITSSMNLEYVYVRAENPSDFGAEKKVVFATPLSLVIDAIKPVVNVDTTSALLDASTTALEITGTVVEDNLEKLICSTSSLSDADIQNGAGAIVPVAEDGTFAYTAQIAVDEVDVTYYFYAVDKTGRFSDEVNIHVQRDNAAPVISNAELHSVIKSYVHGNYANSEISLTVSGNDVTDSCSASGVWKVRLYKELNQAAFMEIEAGQSINDGSSYEFAVELAAADLAQATTVYVSIVDNKNNESTPYELNALLGTDSNHFMIETTAPTVEQTSSADYTASDSGCVWYQTAKNIVLAAKDIDGSGICEVSVSVDGSEWTQYTIDKSTANAATLAETIELLNTDLQTLSAGHHTIIISVTDFAGNTSEKSFTVGYDAGAPIVNTVMFEEVASPVAVLDLVGFENYYNKYVGITIEVADTLDGTNAATDCVGAKDVTLWLDGTSYGTSEVVDNKVTFVVPGEQAPDDFVQIYEEVKLTVTDYLGNVLEGFVIINEDTGNLIIDWKNPVISWEKEDVVNGTVNPGVKTDNTDVYYYSPDTDGTFKLDFAVSAEDDLELEQFEVQVNDKVVSSYGGANAQLLAAISHRLGFVIESADGTEPEDTYHIVVKATDKAGNTEEVERTYCKDITAPAIASATYTTQSENEIENLAFFNGDTPIAVRVTVSDTGAGTAKLVWGTLDENGEFDGNITGVVTEGVSDGTVAFNMSVKKYSGKIGIRAIDVVGNVGDIQIIETDSSISDIVVINSSAKVATVTANAADNKYKDVDNKPLYGKAIETVPVKITVSNTDSGIAGITWKFNDTAVTAELTYDATAGWSVTGAGEWDAIELDGTVFPAKVSGTFELAVAGVEGNDLSVSIEVTDFANKTTKSTAEFSIDRTAPEITVEIDGEADAEHTDFYKEERTATIVVKDKNFTEEQLKIEIENTDGSVPGVTGWNQSEDGGEGRIVFSEEGDYTVRITGTDLAENEGTDVFETEFTIDMTSPVITVRYSNDDVLNGNYYAQTQTAIIEIKEHNFVDERIEITGTATVDGAAVTFPSLGTWSEGADTYTAVITFDTDGLYQFNVDYTDKAGNEAEQYVGEEFYVDMTAPVIEITGVEDMSANNGDVVPRISITDSNYNAEGVTIDLYGANGGNQTSNGAYSGQANGQIYTFANFPKEQSSDDIYTVTATATDMAGNETMDEITFSVNRFGSVYVFDNSLKEIAGTYVQEEIDVMLTEVNVDSLEHDSIRVVVDANGSLKDLTEGVDYTVSQSGGNGSWYQYDYTIDKSLFAGDGRYIVTLYSEDVAGNVNENIDESKEAEISFGIDKTPPVIIPIDIASEEQYDLDVKTATVTVNDNLVLQDVQVFVGENQSEYTAEGENYVFDIPSSTDRQDITIAAVDAAGNRTNYVISGVLVTTNAFIRLINNTPLLVGSILGVAGIGGGGVAFVGLCRRRKYNLKMK